MKFTVPLILALVAIVDAGTVQTYRQGGNFAYAFNTQQHQTAPLLFQHPTYTTKSFSKQINYPFAVQPNPADYYSGPVYSPLFYQQLLLNNDELFRMEDDENESKWFTSNPLNTAHTLPTSAISVSASASTFHSGSTDAGPSFSSASDAVYNYPLLTLFHRLFNRPSLFSIRPNRPATVSSGPPLMRPVLNNINDSIFTSSMNLLNPFSRPRP
ncbi:hypothetical protein DAPPUDRAFT_303721 [Daphnia pulex]|uniref:Uncharacterized protein n=1 Tax=Daphnia pulex TaxID=6669 RepID=E9GHK6_DAPPU|nr:hypothetical protein DAPPUDRAFT_303721 [Daphnia pulex]|eukprot:EFX81039.1 hypothetical protein DAPPUDRAFT_303721 [Daphnia pulex]